MNDRLPVVANVLGTTTCIVIIGVALQADIAWLTAVACGALALSLYAFAGLIVDRASP